MVCINFIIFVDTDLTTINATKTEQLDESRTGFHMPHCLHHRIYGEASKKLQGA